MTDSEAVALVAVYLLACGAVGALAVTWNRKGIEWVLISLLISPVLGFLLLVFQGKRQA